MGWRLHAAKFILAVLAPILQWPRPAPGRLQDTVRIAQTLPLPAQRPPSPDPLLLPFPAVPCRRLQDTVRSAQTLKSAICQKSALPFEFKVLESLLSETVSALFSSVQESVVGDFKWSGRCTSGSALS